jgi:molybdenum cofactor cytidylyltransferase
MIFGVIPAAGKSSRMGVPKLALPLGDRSILEHAIAALQASAVTTVVVVGKHVAQLVPLVEKANAHALILETETAQMRETVEAGLTWIESRFHPTAKDAWFLLPADHPVLDPEVIRQLAAAQSAAPIVVPVNDGKRGHPVLFAWSEVARIRAFPQEQGIDAYIREHQSDVLELTVAHPGIHTDLDTWQDYERMLRAVESS